MGEEQAKVTLARRIGALKLQLRAEQEATAHSGWLAAVVALVIAAPWIIFASSVPVSHFDSLQSAFLFCAVYLVVQIVAHVLAICGPLSPQLGYKPTLIAGGIMFAAGVVAMFASDTLLSAQIVRIVVACVGAALCGLGQVLLIAKWYPHFVRMDAIMAFTIGWAGAFMAMAGFCLLAFLDARVGVVVIALLYIVVPIASVVKIPDYVARVQLWADSMSDSVIMVRNNRFSTMVFITVICAAIGFGVLADVNQAFAGNGMRVVRPELLVAGVLALLVYAFVRIRVYNSSETACTLNVVVLLLAVGLLRAEPAFGSALGPYLLAFTSVLLECFYLPFYSGICHQRFASEVSYTHILRMSHVWFPVGLLAGALLYGASDAFEGAWPILSYAFGVVILVMYFSMFVGEVSRTRSELVAKGTSTVSIVDIERFADEHKDYKLTKRECEVIQLMMSGYSIKSIGEELFVSQNTVKSHVSTIYRKIGVHKRQEMIDIISVAIRK